MHVRSFVRSSDCTHLSVELGHAQSSGDKRRSPSITAAGRDEARTGSCCRERPKLGRVEDSMHDGVHLYMPISNKKRTADVLPLRVLYVLVSRAEKCDIFLQEEGKGQT